MLTLVLGGIRSGKSAFARQLATDTGRPVTYLATGVASDDEMRRRIDAHRRVRPAAWTCVEEPVALASAVPASAEVLLFESVDGWLGNRMGDRDFDGQGGVDDLVVSCADELERLVASVDHVIAVSSEVGLALVPVHPVGRAFADLLGLLNQHLAAAADETYLVVAGIPVALTGRRTA